MRRATREDLTAPVRQPIAPEQIEGLFPRPNFSETGIDSAPRCVKKLAHAKKTTLPIPLWQWIPLGKVSSVAENALSKRERQIMDIVFQAGEVSAAEVHAKLPDPPTYTAVRTMMRVLEEKGLLRHRSEGRRYIYSPRKSTTVAGRSAMRRVLDVFFDGSLEDAVAAHLNDPRMQLDGADLARLRTVIEDAEQAAKKVRSPKPKKG